MAWHYYCWLLQTNLNPFDKDGKLPIFEKIFCDDWQVSDSFETVQKDIIKLGRSASFLTEFGVCAFNAKNTSNPTQLNTNECEIILDHCDQYFTSWTYWDSNFYDDNFEINKQLVDIYSRVYPRVTNGIPLSLSYNVTTGSFFYTFKMNLDRIDLFTEIFIPDHVYPKGFKVITNPELIWSFNKNNKILYINLNNKFSKIKVDKFFVVLSRN